MTAEPRFGIEYMATSQGSKEETFNELVNRTSAFMQTVVQDKDLNAQPAGVEGNIWIIGPSPTGAVWTGNAGKLAQFISGAWNIITPQEGWTVYVLDEDSHYRYLAAWERYGPRITDFSATIDFASLATGAQDSTQTITISGGAVGDFSLPSCSVDLQKMVLSGYVESATVYRLVLRNDTGGAINLASATFRVRIWKL